MVYLFNPLPEGRLRKVIENLEESLREKPRPAYLLYNHPLLAEVVTEHRILFKVGGTEQYSIFACARARADEGLEPPQGHSGSPHSLQ